MDVSHQIAALLDRLPIAVAMFDASGSLTGKAGQLSGLLGAVLPSRDRAQASRWRFTDKKGAIIPPDHWPSECALRGDVNLAGLVGRYQDNGEHLIKVTSIPTQTPSEVAVMAFLQRIDTPSRCAEGSYADVEQRLVDTLIRAVSAAR